MFDKSVGIARSLNGATNKNGPTWYSGRAVFVLEIVVFRISGSHRQHKGKEKTTRKGRKNFIRHPIFNCKMVFEGYYYGKETFLVIFEFSRKIGTTGRRSWKSQKTLWKRVSPNVTSPGQRDRMGEALANLQ